MPAAWPASSHSRNRGYPGGATAGAMPTRSKPSRAASALSRRVRSSSIAGLRAAARTGSADPQGQRVLDPEVLIDPPRRVRAIQRVEVDPPDVVVQEVAALLGRPVDADALDRLRVVAAAVDRL